MSSRLGCASVLALSAATDACTDGAATAGTPPVDGRLSSQTITVAGAARSYELVVPDAQGEGVPLVFVFHGAGGDGAGMRAGFGAALERDAAGAAIFVYPDGIGGQWDLETAPAANADFALFDALVAELSAKHRVDSERIFATGYSNGGYFVNQLACRRRTIRAIATHAAGGPFGGADEYDATGQLMCPESRAAALVAHGLDDATVAVSEGEKSRDHWRHANACEEASEAHRRSPCVQYTGCFAGRPVVWCAVPGVGHVVWPAEGAAVTWSFFASVAP